MNWFVFKAHRLLPRFVIAITVFTVALSVSFLVQQLDGNISSDLGNLLFLTTAGLIATLAFLSVPGRNDIVVAPFKARHILIQVGVSLCGAFMITLTGLTSIALMLAPKKEVKDEVSEVFA
ncbi:hypothetical protein [Ruegeria atlantica]|uniref:hypothetical protein n=1 Tax=Ruegeria atlantica TaxID=81569 RepID=UPI00147A8015|nr:hypothetical protein [Ruegeria atlantica]